MLQILFLSSEPLWLERKLQNLFNNYFNISAIVNVEVIDHRREKLFSIYLLSLDYKIVCNPKIT